MPADSPTPALLSDEQIAEINRRCLCGEKPTLRTAERLVDHALAASAALAEREGEIAKLKQPWGDKDDEWTPAIRAAHPTETKTNWEAYNTALTMVGHRHGKYELVDLVNWLLTRAETAEATIARQAAEIAGVKGALDLADKAVELLVHSRRPHGYVITTVLPLDHALEAFLRARAALTGGGGT